MKWYLGIILLMTLAGLVLADSIPIYYAVQGRVTNATTNTSLQGTFTANFSIYTNLTGTTPIWNNYTSVVTDQNGIYNYNLNISNLTFNTTYYLGTAIGGDPEWSPRMLMASVGFSYRSNITDYINPNNTIFGNCPSGKVVMNITTGGPQCVPVVTGSIPVLNTTQAGIVNYTISPLFTQNDGSIGISQSVSNQNGYLSGTDWNTFDNKSATGASANCQYGIANITLSATGAPTINCAAQQGTGSGSVTSVGTTAPITGGTITTTGTIGITVLNSTEAGYVNNYSTPLSVTKDGNISINVLNSTQAGYVNNYSAPLSVTKDGNLSITQATAAANGYVSSTDWNTFDNKSATGTTAQCTYGIVNFTSIATGAASVACASQQGTLTSLTFNSPLTGGTITTSGSVGIQAANSTEAGYLNNVTSPLSLTKDGNLSISVLNNTQAGYVNNVSSPLLVSKDGNLSIQVANAAQDGYLAHGDWNTFDNKTATGNTTQCIYGVANFTLLTGGNPSVTCAAQQNSLTLPWGNLTGIPFVNYTQTGIVNNVTTGLNVSPDGNISIANTAITPGTYGGSSTEQILTFNAQGQATSASNTTISIPYSNLTGIPTNFANWTNNTGVTLPNVTVTNASIQIFNPFGLQACNSTSRGELTPQFNGGSKSDILWWCAKNNSDSYNWVELANASIGGSG